MRASVRDVGFNGAKIINIDLSDPDQKALFSGTQKLLAILLSIFESGIYVYTGAVGTLPGAGLELKLIVMLQLAMGSIILLYLDEIVSKYGIGSGISLFIAAGVLYIKQQRPLYESAAQIMVVNSNEGAPNAPDNDIPLLSDLRALTRSRSVNTQVQVISSPEVIAEAFEGIGQEARAAGYGAASFPPAWSYKIEGLSDTDIIVIRIKAYTPGAAADFANGIAATYFARDLRSDAEVMRKARQSAETNMNAAARRMAPCS